MIIVYIKTQCKTTMNHGYNLIVINYLKKKSYRFNIFYEILQCYYFVNNMVWVENLKIF